MFTYLLIFLFSLPFSGEEEACMRQFTEAYTTLKAIQKNQKGLSMSYSIELVTAEGEKQSESLQLKSFGKKAFVQSGSVFLYQDAAAMLAIQQEEKTILITDPIPSVWKQSQLEGVIRQQDSLISNLSLKKCSVEIRADRKLQKMEFTVKGSLRKAGINEVIYWLDGKDIKGILIKYNEKAAIRSWKISIDKLDANYTGESFQGSAVSQALDRKNKLKIAFKDFNLIDKRN